MVKPQGKSIPIQRDKRTLEQRRHDLLHELDKSHGGKKPKQVVHSGGNHGNQLTTKQWSEQLDRWIDETNKWWSHDWNRVWRNMFSLVPVDDFDLDPVGTFGAFGTPSYVPSILARMDRQMKTLQRHLDQLIPDYHPDLKERAERGRHGALLPRGGWGDGMLDYLRDAYEPGEDGKLHFKLRFDLRGYGPEDIHVETANNRLTVHAKRTTKSGNSTQMQEFCRTVYLPDKVESDHFVSNLSEDGILTVEAPVKSEEVGAIKYDKDRQLGIEPTPSTHDKAIQLIGKPGVTVLSGESGGGHGRLHIEVPVESGFKTDDLHVSTSGNHLIVSGRQEKEEEIGSQGKGVYVREFQRSYPIPHSVDPLSLQAKLFDQNDTLVVEAPILNKSQ
ncbi:unnamed protein product [Echinostoma caproni]|uniref:SHSP domain-containing protein n=1 Tax=Echinostoma caproni TaxID=27848 RepID=A0A183AYA3_9TREM|nr:unnamed protein product [Echinostoma caproni]